MIPRLGVASVGDAPLEVGPEGVGELGGEEAQGVGGDVQRVPPPHRLPEPVLQEEAVEVAVGVEDGHPWGAHVGAGLVPGFIFGRLARDPHFDNVTRRHRYSRGPS